MEFMGFQECMQYLIGYGLLISTFISDRHISIASHMNKVLHHIKHYFDIWHLKKSKRLLWINVFKLCFSHMVFSCWLIFFNFKFFHRNSQITYCHLKTERMWSPSRVDQALRAAPLLECHLHLQWLWACKNGPNSSRFLIMWLISTLDLMNHFLISVFTGILHYENGWKLVWEY